MDPIPYTFLAFISVMIFAAAHLSAQKAAITNPRWHKSLLSLGSGIAISYVFLDLLPKLSRNDAVVKNAAQTILPFLERHVYIMALVGFLLFFTVDRSKALIKNQSAYFCLSLSCYTLFNFFLGYAVADQNNPEVQPLALFTFAMTLHLFMNDFSMSQAHGDSYKSYGKWFLVAALFLGWIIGILTKLSPTAIALVSGFIGGGVIMNVTRHELPSKNDGSLYTFLLGAAAYAFVIL